MNAFVLSLVFATSMLAQNTAIPVWLDGSGNASTELNVKAFGAVGDGATDDTVALNAAAALGPIFMPCGTYAISGSIKLSSPNPRIDGESGKATCVTITNGNRSVPALSYTSSVQSFGYDVPMVVHISGLTINSQNGIQLNSITVPTPPRYQGNLVKLDIREVNMQGTYGSAQDPNKWTAALPTVSSMASYGVGLMCTQCYGLMLEGSTIQNFGIGVYYQGDESLIQGNRITYNGNNIIIGATIAASGNNNVINYNTAGGNLRVPAIRLVGATGATKIQGNYFENYCPSSTFLYSTNSIGTDFSFNEIDNPNNSTLSGVCGNVSNAQPMLILDDILEDRIHDNHVGLNGLAVPSIRLSNTNGNHNQYYIYNNSAGFPTPYVQNMIPSGTLNPVITGNLTVSSAGPALTGGSGQLNLGDSSITKDPGSGFIFNSGAQVNGLYSIGIVYGYNYATGSNCSNSASPAFCGSAPAGSVVVAAGSSSVVVQTSAVTANSQILVTFDGSLGKKLGIQCNTVQPLTFGVTGRTPGSGFTIGSAAPSLNPACFSYMIIN